MHVIERSAQNDFSQTVRDADTQIAHGLAGVGGACSKLGYRLQDLPAMLEDFAPDMRQNGRSCAAVEERRCPQRSLEVLHSPGDSRLGEVKAKGSAMVVTVSSP